MADRVGQQLGNYRLSRLLGKGGFAEVYLGEHVYLKTPAAIKLLQTKVANEEDLQAFLKEAQTIAQLVHPHIVRVLDFGVDGETPFLVMDYAMGGTLRQRHPRGTQLPLTTIVSYIKQVAQALQYAHEEKFIHRDVKPENMLVGRRETLLLSDFGIALIAQSSRYQSTQEVIGTVAYMSPEQIQGKPRPGSDQYSLGIVVYEWLCGDRPFHGSFTELCTQHMFASPPPLREKMPTISPAVEQVIMTALAKDPRQRFASVQAFATALEQASQPTRISLSLPSMMAPPSNQASRTPQLATSYGEFSPDHLVQPPVLGTPPGQAAPRALLSSPGVPYASRGISRRTVILGLGVAGLTIAGGSLIWLVSSGKHPSVVSNQTPTTTPQATARPTPTPLPLGTLLYTYRGHSAQVNAVAWSPDGRRIASGSWDQTVQVWDAATGGNVFIYRGYSSYVKALAWSPDGRHIAVAGGDGTVQVWDATDGGNIYIYRGHSAQVNAVTWSPDSRRIASGSNDGTVQVWDAVDGGHVFTYRGHSSYVNAVPWSPNGRRIASGSGDKTVQVWDAADGGNVYIYRGHSDQLIAVAWSPNGQRVASGSFDRTTQVWDAVDGGNVYIYRGHSSYVNAVPWSPDGRRIASGSGDGTVQVWNAANGGNVYIYRGHSDAVWWVAWSPDGRRIASGGVDKTVQVWGAG